MQEIFKSIYREVMPVFLRVKLGKVRFKYTYKRYYREIIKMKLPYEDAYRKEIEYLKKNGQFEIFPHAFNKKYQNLKINVIREEKNSLPYLIHDGKKLFFPSEYNDLMIANIYSALLLEQDNQSPHKYFTENSQTGGILLDIGSAEGIISLECVDMMDKIYLFEGEAKWIDALKETFKPWEDKVCIIKKFVSDVNTENEITLDKFISEESIGFDQKIIMKIDVEGAERKVLDGAKGTIKRDLIKLAICSYHRKDDEEILRYMLESNGFQVSASDGYMLWPFGDDFEAPFFRRGLLRAEK